MGFLDDARNMSIVYYGLCSSVMLVINKVTISRIPLPACVFFVQFLTTFLVIIAGKSLGLLRVDGFDRQKAQRFLLYACIFVLSIYSNGQVLQRSNVETLITFRACSPLLVSGLDWLFLGHELPSARSWLSLLGVLGGAVGYVFCDSEFRMHGMAAYGWVLVYLVVITFEMTFAKHTISSVTFENAIWGSVLYTNALALGPIAALALASGELSRLGSLGPLLDRGSAAALLACSVLGVGMNWAGWNCRSRLTATSYTLLGVACKLISVLLNAIIWDKRASAGGVLWLVVCLSSSTVYQQAPLRAARKLAE